MSRDEYEPSKVKSIEYGSNFPRGVTIQTSGPWAEDQGPDAERRYAQVIAAVVQEEDLDADGLTDRIRARMEHAGLTLADQTLNRLTELLRVAVPGHVNVIDSYGNLLFGDPDATPMRHEPAVRGPEDPESPERPLLM